LNGCVDYKSLADRYKETTINPAFRYMFSWKNYNPQSSYKKRNQRNCSNYWVSHQRDSAQES